MIVRLRALSAPGRVVSAGGFTASVSSAVSPFLSSPFSKTSPQLHSRTQLAPQQ